MNTLSGVKEGMWVTFQITSFAGVEFTHRGYVLSEGVNAVRVMETYPERRELCVPKYRIQLDEALSIPKSWIPSLTKMCVNLSLDTKDVEWTKGLTGYSKDKA